MGRGAAALLLVIGAASAASAQTDAPRFVRTWTVEEMHISARSDGWVEIVAVPWTLAYVSGRTTNRRDRFTPVQIRAWTDSARAFIARAPLSDTSASSSRSLARFGVDGGTLGIHYSKSGPKWTVMSIAGASLQARREPPLALLATLDSAATAAEAASPTPQPIPAGVLEPSQIATRPVVMGNRLVVIDSPRVRGERVTPLEVVARFLVIPPGQVDTSTTEFDAPLPPSERARANMALRQAGVWTPTLGGSAVRTWGTTVLRFRDPRDSAEQLLLNGDDSQTRWAVRNDGRVQLFFGYPWRSEIFDVEAVSRWITVADSIMMRVPPRPEKEFGFWSSHFDPPWLGIAGAATGTRIGLAVMTGAKPYPVLGVGPCGDKIAPEYIGRPGPNELKTLVDEARAAVARARRMRPARPDLRRVHGELEVTCPAIRLDSATAPVTDDSLRMTLALERDAFATFVVDTAGRVASSSVRPFGQWAAADSARIASAIATLRFTVPRISGRAVPQRARYTIAALDIPGAGPPTAQSVCVVRDSFALNIESLRGDVPRGELEAVGIRVAIYLRLRGPQPRGFEFEADPSGSIRAFRFIPDTGSVNRVFGGYSRTIAPTNLMRPGGVPFHLRVTPVSTCAGR